MGFSFVIFSAYTLAIILSLSTFCVGAVEYGPVSYDNRAIKINGQRKMIISGAIHYPRSTPGMWQSLIQKSKLGGLNAIETYVFWNAHEPQYRQYDFTGNLDLVRFIKAIQDEGLYAILRIGPYVCAEWTYGGFPVWLKSLPGIQLRTNNAVYLNEMKTFMALIVNTMTENNLFASQGGPIILAQIENEYGYDSIEPKYGEGGKEYVKWCAQTAQEFQIGIPWIMCQQNDAPPPMISTCNGFYCDEWNKPEGNQNIPKIWTENWTGWFKNWGGTIPQRKAEDLAFAVARFFQRDGTMQNYYMYHGGTNFGNTAGGPYMTTSYDYDAPLDEYGNFREPKWGHLKDLHNALYAMEETILYGEKRDENFGDGFVWVTSYSYEGKRSCFFSNTDEHIDRMLNYHGVNYFIPAWSVSLLPDCYTEVFNTAKVNAQTSIMEYRPNHPHDNLKPYKLEWEWTSEQVLHINRFGSVDLGTSFAANSLLDQKIATNGTNDYMWLMTNYIHNSSDTLWGNQKQIILQVKTEGSSVHAFVNGKSVGSQIAEYSRYEFVFEKKIKLHHGFNSISLLSGTVGFANFGAFFDTWGSGILGPIKLIARSKTGNEPDTVKDISSSKWVYKTGLHGEDAEYHRVKPRYFHNWSTSNSPANRPFTWYKTNFITPEGTDPVVVDLNGMGKGVAWVNGINIGRYWPKYVAPQYGCHATCEYKGDYKGDKKCRSGCGKPTQRYYHIPRDWLKPDNNQLVLFEELGGTTDNVQINTVTIGKVCGQAYEGHTLKIACQGGKRIKKITFASFGNPKGQCDSFYGNTNYASFEEGQCHSANSKPIIEKLCLHKKKCFVNVSEDTFGLLRCPEAAASYKLAIEATC